MERSNGDEDLDRVILSYCRTSSAIRPPLDIDQRA